MPAHSANLERSKHCATHVLEPAVQACSCRLPHLVTQALLLFERPDGISLLPHGVRCSLYLLLVRERTRQDRWPAWHAARAVCIRPRVKQQRPAKRRACQQPQQQHPAAAALLAPAAPGRKT